MLSIQHRHRGFTLIELAIVLVIIGVVLSGFLATLSSRIEHSRRDQTKIQLQEIKQALIGFAMANGRFPCPATSLSNGAEAPVGGGACASIHGFVPGQTLDLRGEYNRDSLLLDSWHNPIRYSVTSVNVNALTTTNGIRNATMALFTPNLRICDGDSASNTTCSGRTLVDNAPFVLISLGNDGNVFAGVTAANSDQGENAGEALMLANPAGENIAYTVGNNRVFVSKEYSETGSTSGKFDDILEWASIYEIYVRMMDAGQLP